MSARNGDGGQNSPGQPATRGVPTTPLAPPLPIAKRLNRNALTVAAVLMGVTVLVAVVTLNSNRSTAGAKTADTDPPVATPAAPSFLDVPVRGGTETVLEHATLGAEPAVGAEAPAAGADGAGLGAMPAVDPYTALPQVPPANPTVEAYRRALTSPVLAASGSTGVAAAVPGTDAGVTLGDATGSGVGAPSPEMAGSSGSLSGTGTRPPAVPGGATTRAPSSLTGATATDGVARPTAAQIAPASPYRLDAGTVLPAALVRAVHSDLPGQLVAQVTRNVYDSRTQRVLLIPQGTKLLGRYDNAIAAGQSRLLVVWTRLIFPDGRSLTIPGAEGTDVRGAAGLPASVDNHYPRIFGNALLTSIISAGVQLSQPQQPAGGYAAPTTRQVAAGAVGQELSTVGLELLRKNLDIRPTMTLPEGHPLNVILSGDLDLPAPYVQTFLRAH